MTKKEKKNNSRPATIKCIDCETETSNYYYTSINKGRVYRCSNCHERWVIRSTRIDIQYKDMEEQQ